VQAGESAAGGMWERLGGGRWYSETPVTPFVPLLPRGWSHPRPAGMPPRARISWCAPCAAAWQLESKPGAKLPAAEQQLLQSRARSLVPAKTQLYACYWLIQNSCQAKGARDLCHDKQIRQPIAVATERCRACVVAHNCMASWENA
jgi:hypothetical protein